METEREHEDTFIGVGPTPEEPTIRIDVEEVDYRSGYPAEVVAQRPRPSTTQQLTAAIDEARKWGLRWRERAREAEGRLKRASAAAPLASKEQELNWIGLKGKAAFYKDKAEQLEARIQRYRGDFENGRRARRAGTVFIFDAPDAWKLGYESQDRELKIQQRGNQRLGDSAVRNFERCSRLAKLVGYEPEDDAGDKPFVDRLVDRVEQEVRSLRATVQDLRSVLAQR